MLNGSCNRWVVVRSVGSSSSLRNSCVSGGRMAWLWVRGYDLHSSKLLCICQLTRTTAAPALAFIVEWLYNVHAGVGVVEECYLVDPASSHMLVSKIKPCMFKKLVVGPWVGSTGPPRGVHRSARPFCRRCAPGLNWPGRASGAVTLKKLECSKQAYALDTLAWDNIIGFRSYSVGLRDRKRKLGARRRSDTVLVSTINDADQGSADVTFRTPLAPYEKSKSLGSGGSMVARLKLKGIDGRAPPGVEPAA
ncbi:hypothetical protein Ddye_032644 [Dipteronia dyeriana]|uniref:Uncharacterized protein n=1 Tax=Dipteronia dyeriana TaxID=168575 RepID=A0AAD9TCS8_9ROSI|nr:hypothetical protein Ddye_032812 [Dipteronia dyeriana]KAK2633445.1 hypothetical protein Ddye_032420 [Dipteronia dyeriana]KAK2633516.1 hypothetical protein Ddye_032540 [Dipteronia dyeriana]KAK2633526.1 hypothetical protein Ddye_032518 [Dipteronia dyeriana]KAK2633529.1 hypothetical protein Ddye_032521 [Dipteronia dyeriana]